MTREEAIAFFIDMNECTYGNLEAVEMAIKALEQEPRKDEVILTNKEYRELMANEYDHGYCKGYAVALEEQESILGKIKAEIGMYETDCRLQGGTDECEKCNSNIFGSIYRIIDKYKLESEGKE